MLWTGSVDKNQHIFLFFQKIRFDISYTSEETIRINNQTLFSGKDKNITKTSYLILTPPPIKPHFYIVYRGLQGYILFFLISAQKHRLLVLVRTRRGGSKEYTQSMF